MARLVEFTEMPDGRSKKKGPYIALIDPDHVGAVFPRRTYTTLIVQGTYVHVEQLFADVLERLGFETEET